MASAPDLPVSTAAASWIDGSQQLHLHVFSCDGYNVTERLAGAGAGGDGWADGTLNVPGAAVSATAWVDSNGGHIRVYCTSEDATTEWCLDGDSSTSWYQGQYTLD